MSKFEVEFINEQGHPVEKIMPFAGFLTVLTLKLGEAKTVTVPVLSELAEYKKVVIRKKANGETIFDYTEKRSDEELARLEQLREIERQKLEALPPPRKRTRGSILNIKGDLKR